MINSMSSLRVALRIPMLAGFFLYFLLFFFFLWKDPSDLTQAVTLLHTRLQRSLIPGSNSGTDTDCADRFRFCEVLHPLDKCRDIISIYAQFRFLPCPFEFVIHVLPSNSMLYTQIYIAAGLHWRS